MSTRWLCCRALSTCTAGAGDVEDGGEDGGEDSGEDGGEDGGENGGGDRWW